MGLDARLEEIYSDEIRRSSLNTPEEDFLKKYNLFKGKAIEARRAELETVGVNPLAAIETYKEAIIIGKEITNSFDPNKYQKLRKFRTVAKAKELVIVFLIGIVAGLTAIVS